MASTKKKWGLVFQVHNFLFVPPKIFSAQQKINIINKLSISKQPEIKKLYNNKITLKHQ